MSTITPIRTSATHVGKTGFSVEGYPIVIIAYRSKRAVDVAFQDGMIAWDQTLSDFVGGKVKRPKVPTPGYSGNVRIGRSITANNGQRMYILNYRRASDLDVIFEDGTVVTHKKYTNFIRGAIRNPNCKTKKQPLTKF